MIRPNTFYVYVHSRPDGGVFYVGKGSWTPKKSYGRAASTENRNVIWRRTVEKAGGFATAIIAEFFVEQCAFALERELIALHGRKDLGGALCNLTDGGEGACGRTAQPETIQKFLATMAAKPKVVRTSPMKGRKHTEETKAMIAEASRALRPMLGRSHSIESRTRMSTAVRANHSRSRAVVDAATGISYPSVREAGRQMGINPNTLKLWMSGRAPNKSTLRYV